MGHIFEDDGNSNASSSLICDYYVLAWFFNNNPNIEDYSSLSETQKVGSAVMDNLGKKTLGPNPFNFNTEILMDGKKINKVFSLEHDVVKKLLWILFTFDRDEDILNKYYNKLDHGIFCTSCGMKLESLYKYLFYKDKRDEGLQELRRNFSISEFSNNYDEDDEEYISNEIDEFVNQDVEEENIEEKSNDESKKDIDKFIDGIELILGPCIGKLTGKKIDTTDKYILGYLYGICDYTNQIYGLDNEINGIGTFMRLHSFVFNNSEDADLGKIMGTTIKLNTSEEPSFMEGMMDGGSSTAKMANSAKPSFETYIKLRDYVRENYS